MLTKDNGFQPIKWIGSQTVDAAALKREERLRPIRITAGALANGLPMRDLIVSPQHRMLLCSPIAKRMFGSDEIFVIAKKLAALEGVDVLHPENGIEYFHFLLPKHEIVFAEEAEAESLFLGPEAIKTLSETSLLDVEFRQQREDNDFNGLARPNPKDGKKISRFFERYAQKMTRAVSVASLRS